MISDVSDISGQYGGLLIILIFTAMNKNFEDYLKAILEHYEVVKNGKDADLLENPTPGNLKKLCLQHLEKELSNADRQAFFNFFHPKDEQALYAHIKNMNADGLRTPSDFLRMRQGLTNNRQHANLVAVLVGFEPRPFTTFQNTLYTEEEEKTTAAIDTGVSKEEKARTDKTHQLPVKRNQAQDTPNHKPVTSRKRKIVLVAIAVLLFGGMSGFLIHKTTEKQCMVWKEDHFEKIDCQQSTISGIKGVEKIQAYNEELFAQQKIIPSDTTTFFKNGKSALYYLKKDNKYEFFTLPGKHPVHQDSDLRRVTKRIISRWEACENKSNP